MFLTTGRSGIAAFGDSNAYFVIRVVTEPEPGILPRRHRLLLSRGPYRYDDEYALMREFGIEALVTKNSGGAMTQPKLTTRMPDREKNDKKRIKRKSKQHR